MKVLGSQNVKPQAHHCYGDQPVRRLEQTKVHSVKSAAALIIERQDPYKNLFEETHWGNDAIRLALPERDIAVGLDDDVAGLSGGLRPHDTLHALHLAGERLPGAEGVQWYVALLKLEGHLGALNWVLDGGCCRSTHSRRLRKHPHAALANLQPVAGTVSESQGAWITAPATAVNSLPDMYVEPQVLAARSLSLK